MIKLPSLLARNYRVLRGATVVLSTCATAALLTGSLHATPIPANLGNGLGKLVESNMAVTSAKKSGIRLERAVTDAKGRTYVDVQTANLASLALGDDEGRVLVRVTLNGKATFKETKRP